jgi:hypothetical protein
VVVTAVAHAALLASLLDLAQAGRRVVLFTLAEKPPAYLPDVVIYHLPHLVEDLIAPSVVGGNCHSERVYPESLVAA